MTNLHHLKHKPDIICLSKGLTGGVMPLGVTSCAQFIFDAFLSDDKMKTFFQDKTREESPMHLQHSLGP